MTNRRHRLLHLGLGLLLLNLTGCASSGGSSVTSWRPGFGWSGSAGSTNSQRTWNGPLVQPGTGLQPTPAMTSPPAIVPGTDTGPMLPDASGSRYRPFPWTTGVRYPRRRGGMLPPQRALPQQQWSLPPQQWSPPPQQRTLPPVVPQQGAPIAQQADPSMQRPAELSGQIEIIPGPTLRARRARMEMLPPPPEADTVPRPQETSPPGDDDARSPIEPSAG